MVGKEKNSKPKKNKGGSTSQGELFELTPKKSDPRAVGVVMLKNLIMVGRSINCDLCVNIPTVSNIHAVVEVREGQGYVYDMNSSNGTTINGKKIKETTPFAVGDTLGFGGVEFEFKYYQVDEQAKYKLDVLAPDKSEILFPGKSGGLGQVKDPSSLVSSDETNFPFISGEDEYEHTVTSTELKGGEEMPPPIPEGTGTQIRMPPKEPAQKVQPLKAKEEVPQGPTEVVYPLAKDAKADYNEYIFEDINEVHPIFDYQVDAACVEVIILYKDDLLSVDYLPEKTGSYYLSGFRPKGNEICYPPLGKKNKQLVVGVKDSKVYVHPLEGFSLLFLQDSEAKIVDHEKNLSKEKDPIELKSAGIARFHQKNMQIFIRRVDPPPEVKHAPFVEKDVTLLKKFIAPIVGIIIFFFLLTFFIEVKEEDKKEKNQKRLAKILRRPKKPSVKQAKLSKSSEKKVDEKKSDTKKDDKKKAVSDKKSTDKKTKTAKKGSKKTKTVKKVRKKVETYKPANFKSSISSLLKKGRAAKLGGAKKSKRFEVAGKGSFVGSNVAQKLKRASVSTKVGSLEGVSAGKLDSSTGTKGLAKKGAAAVADIPTKTVVRGSIDPQIILQILREHLSQFQHCYQRELEKQNKHRFEGPVIFNFRIGASGHVVKSSVSRSKVKRLNNCLNDVMRGIKFPKPKGGGIVDVKQTINFNISQ